MTRNFHRRHFMNKVKQAAHVGLVLATSAALCLVVALVWKACWTLILTPP